MELRTSFSLKSADASQRSPSDTDNLLLDASSGLITPSLHSLPVSLKGFSAPPPNLYVWRLVFWKLDLNHFQGSWFVGLQYSLALLSATKPVCPAASRALALDVQWHQRQAAKGSIYLLSSSEGPKTQVEPRAILDVVLSVPKCPISCVHQCHPA